MDGRAGHVCLVGFLSVSPSLSNLQHASCAVSFSLFILAVNVMEGY